MRKELSGAAGVTRRKEGLPRFLVRGVIRRGQVSEQHRPPGRSHRSRAVVEARKRALSWHRAQLCLTPGIRTMFLQVPGHLLPGRSLAHGNLEPEDTSEA